MTNVEVLLRVESGVVPEGVQVFYERQQDLSRYRAWRVLAGLMGAITVVAALSVRLEGIVVWEIALLALVTAFLAVMATPVIEEAEEPHRRRVLVICHDGLITRDPWGLLHFGWDEIKSVSRCEVEGRPHLCVEDFAGHEHLLDHGAFEDAERIFQAVASATRR